MALRCQTFLPLFAWIALGNLVCGGTIRGAGFADVLPVPRTRFGISSSSCLARCSAGGAPKLCLGNEEKEDSAWIMAVGDQPLDRRDCLAMAGRGTALVAAAALLAGAAEPSYANGGRGDEGSGKQGLRGRGAKGYREVRDESVGYSIMIPPLIRVANDEARDRRHNLILSYKGEPGLTIEIESRVMPFDFPGLLDIDTVQIGVLQGPGADRNETKLRRREIRTVGSVKAYLWEYENVTSGDITRTLTSSVERQGRTWLTYMIATSPKETLEDYYVQRDVIGVFDSFLLFTSQKPYGQRRNFGLSDTSLRFFTASKRYADEELEVSELRKAGRLILVGREGARRRSDASAPTSSLRDTRPGQPNTPTTQSGPAGAGADADSTGNGGESDAALDNRNDSSAQDGVGADALRDAAKDGADAVPEEGSPDQVQSNEADSRIPLKQM